MQPFVDVHIMALKAVHDIPEMWSSDQYRQLLQALEFDDIDDIETADLFDMTVMALQDLKPEAAAEAVLKVLLGDRLHAGIRHNLVHEMKEQRMWEAYGQVDCHADLFLTAILLNHAFANQYPRPEIGCLTLTLSPQNSLAAKQLTTDPSPSFIMHLLADGMDEDSILKRLYAAQLKEQTIPDAPAIIWYSQVRSREEASLQLVVYSSWYWLRPLKNIRQYQSPAKIGTSV